MLIISEWQHNSYLFLVTLTIKKELVMYFIIAFHASSSLWNVTHWAFKSFRTSHIYLTPPITQPTLPPLPTSLFLSNSSFPIIYLLTPTSSIFLALQDKICSPMWVLLADSNVLLSSMNCQSTSSYSAPFLSWPFHDNCKIKWSKICVYIVWHTLFHD